MTNNGQFNAVLNSCQRPRAACTILQAMSTQELNRFKNPHKAADMLLAVAGSVLKEDGQHE